MSTPSQIAPAVDESSTAGEFTYKVRVLSAWLGRQLWRGLVVTGCSLMVLLMVLRFGIKWRTFCDRSGIAQRETKRQRHVTNHELRQGRAGAPQYRLVGVPKVRKWRVTQHGARVLIEVCTGHDRDTYANKMDALRHALRIQHVKVVECGRSGFLELELLRKDPLGTVQVRPRVEGQTVICARDHHGREAGIDFGKNPHLLVAGATGSGKSSYVNALLAGISYTEDQFVLWDLKFGLEAQLLAQRASAVCENPEQVEESAEFLLSLAKDRADILKTFHVQSVADLEKEHGIRLRRIYIVVDEVAELALFTVDGDSTKELQERRERVMAQVLRLVQLVRAMGIHVVLSGQRFGSDIGAKVTSIRAQMPGRVCGQVNDLETAKMALAGMDQDALDTVMRIDRAGLLLVKEGQGYSLQRPQHRSAAELMTIARLTSHQAMPLTAVSRDDASRAFGEVTT